MLTVKCQKLYEIQKPLLKKKLFTFFDDGVSVEASILIIRTVKIYTMESYIYYVIIYWISILRTYQTTGVRQLVINSLFSKWYIPKLT